MRESRQAGSGCFWPVGVGAFSRHPCVAAEGAALTSCPTVFSSRAQDRREPAIGAAVPPCGRRPLKREGRLGADEFIPVEPAGIFGETLHGFGNRQLWKSRPPESCRRDCGPHGNVRSRAIRKADWRVGRDHLTSGECGTGPLRRRWAESNEVCDQRNRPYGGSSQFRILPVGACQEI